MSISDEAISSLINQEVLERRTKVMFLKNAGATWATIAKEVGVSMATVRKDYRVVCRDINNENPADVVARHRAVVYDIQRAFYPAMMRGDKDAAATILRALDRESKLLGLDAPTRVLATVSDVEFANEAARLIERIHHLDPTTLKELERAHHTSVDVIDAETDPATTDQPEPGAGTVAATPAAPARGPGQGGPGLPGPAGDTGGAEQGQGVAVPRGAQPAGPDQDDDDDDDWSNID